MHVHILGSGAGGGFPQWNCNCSNCNRLRRGEIQATPRSQSSITVSANGADWILFNASPDIRSQLESFPALQPARSVRDTAICAVVLIDAQIDHATGLMTLRENDTPLDIFCTDMVHQDLTSGYPLLKVLDHYCGVKWHPIRLDANAAFTIPKFLLHFFMPSLYRPTFGINYYCLANTLLEVIRCNVFSACLSSTPASFFRTIYICFSKSL